MPARLAGVPSIMKDYPDRHRLAAHLMPGEHGVRVHVAPPGMNGG